MSGVQIGHSAMQILGGKSWQAETGPTIWEAREAIEHMKAAKEELWEAVAYLALQANTYRAMSNQDAHLALVQITRIAAEYNMRRSK